MITENSMTESRYNEQRIHIFQKKETRLRTSEIVLTWTSKFSEKIIKSSI